MVKPPLFTVRLLLVLYLEQRRLYVHQRAKYSATGEGRIDGSDDGSFWTGVEELEKMRRLDHIGHDTTVVSEEETARTRKDCEGNVETKTHGEGHELCSSDKTHGL